MRRGTWTILGAAPAVLALALLWRIYARPVHVREIALERAKLMGRAVTVRGTVAPSFEVPPMGWGIFCLDDGTGKILVLTRGDVPEVGSRTSARGRIRKSKTYGTVVVTGRGTLE